MSDKKLVIYYPIDREQYRVDTTLQHLMNWSIEAYSFEDFLAQFKREKYASMIATSITDPTIDDCRDHDIAVKLVFVSVAIAGRYGNMTHFQLEERRKIVLEKIRKEAVMRPNEMAYVPEYLLREHNNLVSAIMNDVNEWEDCVLSSVRNDREREKDEERAAAKKREEMNAAVLAAAELAVKTPGPSAIITDNEGKPSIVRVDSTEEQRFNAALAERLADLEAQGDSNKGRPIVRPVKPMQFATAEVVDTELEESVFSSIKRYLRKAL